MRRATGLATFIALAILAAAADAQPTGKLARVGLFGELITPDGLDSLRQGLRDLGYVEGRNLVFEQARSSADISQRAAELVNRNVDVVVALNTLTARVARDTITTIPVVFVTFADPVRAGLVTNLARPGGNMTGLTLMAGELAGKRLQLLREAIPRVARVAVLWNSTNRDTEEQLAETRAAARSLGLHLEVHSASAPRELAAAFGAAAKAGTDAVFVLSDTMFYRERGQIAGLAQKNRLPTMYHWRAYVEAGGLMSYGSNLAASQRRAAYFVDSILKGVKPGDLPVEQPTKFELVINLRAAKALALTIPQSLLLQADQIIE